MTISCGEYRPRRVANETNHVSFGECATRQIEQNAYHKKDGVRVQFSHVSTRYTHQDNNLVSDHLTRPFGTTGHLPHQLDTFLCIGND